jgi:hypothetical protein
VDTNDKDKLRRTIAKVFLTATGKELAKKTYLSACDAQAGLSPSIKDENR